MAAPTDPKTPTPPPEDEEREQEAAATFGEALEAFEKDATPAAPSRGPRKRKAPGPHRLGARVKGKVVSIAADVMLVDVGARSEAVADAREFRDEEGKSTVNVGDEVELHVVEAGEPLTLARAARSKGKGKGHVSLEALRQARAAGLPVRGKVTGTNKGGWTVDVDGVRAFCPLSQVDLQRVEDVTPWVGRMLEFLVTEVDESRARVVLSRRAHLARQQADQARERLAQLAPGQELEGKVTRLEPFGAFIDLGGIEGLVHVSEISHGRVGHARDVVAVGDQVRVQVLKVEAGDERRPRVSLSIRATTPDPWETAVASFSVGARVPGVVVRLADFGAFVNLAPGVDGLVHVSQASDRRITHVREVLSPGQAVEVIVLAVEPERKRISLSIRDAAEGAVAPSQVTRDERGEEHSPVRREGRGEGRREGRGAGAGRSGARPSGGGGGDRRGPRRDERGAGPRESRREGRRESEPETRITSSSSRPGEPEALTPMQLAFKKAREEQLRREQRG